MKQTDELAYFNKVVADFCRQQGVPLSTITALEARNNCQLTCFRVQLSPLWKIILGEQLADGAVSTGFNQRAARLVMEDNHRPLLEAYYQTPVNEIYFTGLIDTQFPSSRELYCITIFSEPLFRAERDWRDKAEPELTRSVAKNIRLALGRGPQHMRTMLLDKYAVYIIFGLIADSVLACSDSPLEFHYRQSTTYILEKALDAADMAGVHAGAKSITINWPDNRIIIVAPLADGAAAKFN